MPSLSFLFIFFNVYTLLLVCVGNPEILIWVLGTKLRCFGRKSRCSNHWSIFPADPFFFLITHWVQLVKCIPCTHRGSHPLGHGQPTRNPRPLRKVTVLPWCEPSTLLSYKPGSGITPPVQSWLHLRRGSAGKHSCSEFKCNNNLVRTESSIPQPLSSSPRSCALPLHPHYAVPWALGTGADTVRVYARHISVGPKLRYI